VDNLLARVERPKPSLRKTVMFTGREGSAQGEDHRHDAPISSELRFGMSSVATPAPDVRPRTRLLGD
jgi:hypothetical protein